MTNKEKINQMSDEELSEIIHIEWLEREVTEDDNGGQEDANT